MALIDDHLLCLGLDASVSAKELKKAYRREMQKWHPDHFHNDPMMLPAAGERAKRINAAFKYLSKLLEKGPLPRSTVASSTKPRSRANATYRTKQTDNGKPFKPGFPDPSVIELFVKSSHIVSAGYNRGTETLYIKFQRNRIYAFHNVPASVFVDFMAAESHGKFANRHIYSCYPYVAY